MADKLLKSITFPDLTDKYIVGDTSLSVAGAGADSKTVGDKFAGAEADLENIINASTVQTLSNNTPYLFRQTPKAGHSEFDTLVGGSVAWNQLAKNDSAPTSRNGLTITGSDTYFTINGTATQATDARGWFGLTASTVEDKANHVAFVSFIKISGTEESATNHYFSINDASDVPSRCSVGNSVIVKWSSTVVNCVWVCSSGSKFTNAQYRIQVHDLTAMFGSTVADAIYAMEQATAGSGVAYFRSLFGASYYPYNSGELMSVSGVSAHNMTGFNQWDEEWEEGMINDNTGQPETNPLHDVIRSKNFSKALPNTSYYGMSANNTKRLVVLWYDSQYGFLGRSVVGNNASATSPANASYFKMRTADDYGGVYKHDICINISSPKNGTYEPYEIHSYPLDNSLTLRGIPKWNNGLYYDGDVYEADGTVNRKYGVVDLGTLTWLGGSWNGGYRYNATVPNINTPSGSYTDGIICAKLIASDAPITGGDFVDGAIARGGGQVYVSTNYSSADAFKTAMNGVYLVYELATPTTETADPYQKAQICDPSGTEEYVSTSIVPVGHETDYPMTITDIAPTSNGTYTLNCTVSGGVKTYEWASA